MTQDYVESLAVVEDSEVIEENVVVIEEGEITAEIDEVRLISPTPPQEENEELSNLDFLTLYNLAKM